ncbi:conserved oligomeric Golgi complex subunit 2-like [Dioscorea cayenensis subsp. rotundata]|uniref:Conserved oligomeric Golgi complex subunit 2-like n=1 Tax=Dioscorea cayennensis subsp. rotundata TaxID=55577 RepID=A0AB40AT02_DIOCR|nr:conserved oligomeric Golgi complex subunit 2-like [Dioscorea cayenensis subsp. rotundata]XP_039117939.1 conserved oligomeric Golgi complex subunit 2-like [Dioscorea cayenensis subsp. rotundata]
MRQWNVGVYFSLSFQEIAGTLDSVLTVGSITFVDDLNDNGGKDHKLLMRQSVALMESLRSCWNENVIVFSSTDKFLRLYLQLISRLSSWLSSGLEARKAHHLSSNSTTNSAHGKLSLALLVRLSSPLSRQATGILIVHRLMEMRMRLVWL